MSKARLIIADDDPIIRINLREALTDHGYEVVAEAGDAQTAIDEARRLKPDGDNTVAT